MVKKKKVDKEGKTKITEEDIEKRILEKLEEYGKDLSKEEKELQLEALKKALIQRQEPKEAMGISEENLELMYSQAYTLYQAGNFKEANNFFRMLSFLDRKKARNWHGLAATYHKLGEFERAAESYFAWAVVQKDTPLPYYHASDCFEQMNNKIGAFFALNGAISRCADNPEYAKIKEKCMMMKEKLNQELHLEESTESEEKPKL